MICSLGSFRWNQTQDVQLHPCRGGRPYVPRCSGISASSHHQQNAAVVQKAGGQHRDCHQAKGKAERTIDSKYESIQPLDACEGCRGTLRNFLLHLSHVTNLGHGPSAYILERRCSAGLSGHHSGDVDPPAGMAALWRPNATWESCFCLVKLHWLQPQCRCHVGRTHWFVTWTEDS